MLKLVRLRWLATTENPSFSCNKALLSRCRVLALQAIDSAAGATLLARVASHLMACLILPVMMMRVNY